MAEPAKDVESGDDTQVGLVDCWTWSWGLKPRSLYYPQSFVTGLWKPINIFSLRSKKSCCLFHIWYPIFLRCPLPFSNKHHFSTSDICLFYITMSTLYTSTIDTNEVRPPCQVATPGLHDQGFNALTQTRLYGTWMRSERPQQSIDKDIEQSRGRDASLRYTCIKRDCCTFCVNWSHTDCCAMFFSGSVHISCTHACTIKNFSSEIVFESSLGHSVWAWHLAWV